MKLNNDFKEKLNKLQDDADSKDVQIALLESEMQDVTTPSNAVVELKSKVMDMLFEVVKVEKAKGITEKTKANRERLEHVLILVNFIGGIGNTNYFLKGANKLIHAKYQLLRVENSELRTELQKIADAEKFLATE